MNHPIHRSSLRKIESERAFVLIIVLWISVGLVCVALLFGQSMMLEYRAADNTVAGAQADRAIDGAVRYIEYVLKNAETPGLMPDLDDYQNQWVDVGDSIYWFIGRDFSNPSLQTPAFGLVDESSKLNLNTVTQDMLKLLPGMTDQLAAAIIDWRDEDTDVSENGAESDAYQLGTASYECKNATFETVDELHLVRGAEWAILYGEDANRNGVLDLNENDGNLSSPEDNKDGKLDGGILDYFTIYSREPNKNSEGSQRINIAGSGSQEQLTQLLQEKLDEDRATEIIANLGNDTTSIESVLEFYIKSKMTEDEFAKIESEICVTDDEYSEGLINIGTAPAAVLACVPGIGEENAASVVSYRKSNSDNLDTVAWLAKALDEENAIQAGPYITSHTYQYTVDVAAVGHDGKGYRRALFVVDLSGSEPIICYRKDLTHLGWALGYDVRNELIAIKESPKR